MASGTSKRKDGRYQKAFSLNGKRYFVYGATIKECKEAEINLRQDIISGAYSNNRSVTLSRYYSEWESMRSGTVKPSTIYTDRTRFNRIEPILGNRKLCQIERREITQMRKTLQNKGLSTTVCNSAVSLLSSIFKQAMIDNIVDHNPCDGIRALKRTEPAARDTIHRALTDEEIKIFFSAAADSWYCDLFMFLLKTGCRVGEASALTWSDIDPIKREIHITKTLSRCGHNDFIITDPKTKTSKRVIPMSDDVRDILRQRRLLENVLQFDGRIFTNTNGGYITPQLTETAIKYAIKKAARNGNELEYFSVHAFRDTFATIAIRSGMNPNTLKNILGHSSLSMTMDLYAHVLPDMKQSEMKNVLFVV